MIINIFLFLAGYNLTIIKLNNSDIKKDSCDVEPVVSEYVVKVTSPPAEKSNSYKILAEIIAQKENSVFRTCNVGCVFYLEKNANVETINYGDFLNVECMIKEIDPPRNPAEFNYKRFMERKRVFYQGYLKYNKWKIIDKNKGNVFYHVAYEIRKTFLHKMKRAGLDRDEFSVASAIILGYDDKLEKTMKRKYSGAGAMHILCVSGLHVGIIFMFFSNILKWLIRCKHKEIYQAIILLLIIWFYAMLTGFSPSVLRASTMFSFFTIGKTIKRHTNIYNTLAASAFFLLLFDPLIIHDVGFQLSYAAVFAIVSLQPVLYKLITFNYWLPDKIWAITTVSVAAQIGTFPISIYYFHQFPNYFILTNLIVIPLSFIIIFSGLIVVIFLWWDWLSNILTILLKGLMIALNSSVVAIHEMPFSTTTGISLDVPDMILIYITMFLLYHFIVNRKFVLMKFILTGTILIFIYFSIDKYFGTKKNELIIYDINKLTAIDFINNGKNVLIADSALLRNKGKIKFHIQNNWIKRKIINTEFISMDRDTVINDIIYKENDFIIYNDHVFFLLKKDTDLSRFNDNIKVDYLIVCNSSFNKPEKVLQKIIPGEIVIASSNYSWVERKWKKEALKRRIAYYSVSDSGYYLVE